MKIFRSIIAASLALFAAFALNAENTLVPTQGARVYQACRNAGKSIAVFGGSLSVNKESNAAKQIWADRLGSTVTTYGVGGAGFSSLQGYTLQRQVREAGVYDIYVLWASTNDYNNSRDCGQWTDYTEYDNYDESKLVTQCGGINYCIKTLREKNPEAIIYFFTSLKFFSAEAGYDPDSKMTNATGKNFAQYIEAQKQCCAHYGIPVLDQFNIQGLDLSNYAEYYLGDKLHMTEEGYRRIAGQQADFLSGGFDPDCFAAVPGCCKDVVVALDGSGDFTSIQTAVNSLRSFKPEGRARILVKNGVYEEKVTIPSHKSDISIIGESRDSTILIWHDHANIPGPDGVGIGTFQTWTLRVEGPGFICANMTVVNDAMSRCNPNWWNDRKDNVGVGQAVALHVEGDRAVFSNCRFLGFQDTIYTGNPDGRELFVDCYVEGTVDFIFGPAAAWFERCEVKAIRSGYYTAASTPSYRDYGYVFNKCRFTADETVKGEWLGRPWRRFAYTLLKECDIQADVRPEGWNNWNNPENEKTARYFEYNCTGPGAGRDARAGWTRGLSAAEAAAVTPQAVFFLEGRDWAPGDWAE